MHDAAESEMITGMNRPASNRHALQLHPLVWLLAPGMVSLVLAPPGIVLLTLAGLICFSLPGIFLARWLLPATTHRYLFWAVVIPAGYLLSTALSITAILFAGFSTGLCMGIALVTGLMALAVDARYRRRFQTAETSQNISTPTSGSLFTGLVLAVLLTVLLAIPYLHVGVETDAGIAYRAYYSGDYLKHVAVTVELMRGVIPPDNPYFAGEKLHYYWMFYLFPAMIAETGGADTVEPVLQTVNLFLAGVFIGLWIFTVRQWIRRRWLQILVILMPFCFASFEGVAVFREVMQKGWPWDGFRAYNVDGYSRWIFDQPEVDTLFRLIQYNMQHILPAAFFLVFLNIFKSREHVSLRTASCMGLICAMTIGHSGFLGSFLTLWTGLCLVLLGPWTLRGIWERLRLGTVMSIWPLAALILYKNGFQMLGTGGNPLALTLVKPVAEHPFLFFLLNFGIAVPGFIALFNWRRLHRPAIILAVLAVLWVAFIIVPDWPSDVGVKVGYTLALALALLTGQMLDRIPARRRLWNAAAAFVMITAGLVALPSLAMEVYNSADIENTRYVSFIDSADWDAYAFIRNQLPRHARIQAGPVTTSINAPFSPVPTFAHRHTYCGDWMHAHIFLIPDHEYRVRHDQITRMFKLREPAAVYSLCRDAGITHLYWGATENASYGPPHHLLLRPDLFTIEWSHVETDRQLHLFRLN